MTAWRGDGHGSTAAPSQPQAHNKPCTPHSNHHNHSSQAFVKMGGGWVHTLNVKVADSKIGRYFELQKRGSTFSIEIRAGIVCFLTVRRSGSAIDWMSPERTLAEDPFVCDSL